jgi:hypothetical protein
MMVARLQQTEDGNGAKEALQRYFASHFDTAEDTDDAVTHLLAWLWDHGFVVVPLSDERALETLKKLFRAGRDLI